MTYCPAEAFAGVASASGAGAAAAAAAVVDHIAIGGIAIKEKVGWAAAATSDRSRIRMKASAYVVLLKPCPLEFHGWAFVAASPGESAALEMPWGSVGSDIQSMRLGSLVRPDERDDLVDHVLDSRPQLLVATANAVGQPRRCLLMTAPPGSMAVHVVFANNHRGSLPDASEFG